MRLSVSLGLWLVGLTSLVVAVAGSGQLAEEEKDLYAAATRELTLVATAVRSTVENAVRDGQEPDIRALLDQLELKDPAVDVFVFRAGAELLGSSWGSGERLELAQSVLDSAQNKQDTLAVQRLSGGEMAVVAPFRATGRIAGKVVILRPPNSLQADLRDERNAVWTSIVILMVVISGVIWTVVNLRVQRPIAHMVAVARKVAAGDLSQRINRQGTDELAELAGEFDAMVQSVDAARVALVVETEAREKLEAEMMRANRLAIVGELAATLAHEVGSPLQVLGGRAHDIAGRQDIPSDVVRSASIIVAQVERVHQIVERLLDVARRKSPVMQEVDVNQALRNVLELFSSKARHAGVRLEVEAAPSLRIECDPAHLQQVLLNLLQNAIRASPKGGVVRLEAAPATFWRESKQSMQPSILIAVEDSGEGIAQPHRNRVFEPFFTGWSQDPQHQGTGLGLSVVKTIMNEHGGTVAACAPKILGGARFEVHFPTRNAGECHE